MRFISIFAAILLLCGCSFFQAIVNPNPNVVASLEAMLAAADNGALIYVTKLPKCGSQAANGSLVCSDPVIVKKIGLAAQDAYIAVHAARLNENASTIEAAQNAVQAFQNIVSTLKRQ